MWHNIKIFLYIQCFFVTLKKALKVKVKVKSLSRVRLLATPWTAAYQAAPSMGFARQEFSSVQFSELLSRVRLCDPMNHNRRPMGGWFSRKCWRR